MQCTAEDCLLTTVAVQAVLAHSLPLKQAKAGLRNLTLWGKVTARNGKVGHRSSKLMNPSEQTITSKPVNLYNVVG